MTDCVFCQHGDMGLGLLVVFFFTYKMSSSQHLALKLPDDFIF